jgi:hypothetical protein
VSWQSTPHFISLKLYDATQFVPGQQRNVAAILGVSEDNVRVICPFIGGGFGSKPAIWTHSPLTAAAARALNRRDNYTSSPRPLGRHHRSTYRLLLADHGKNGVNCGWLEPGL